MKALASLQGAEPDLIVETALLVADLDADRNEALRWLMLASEAKPDDSLIMEKLVDALRVAKRSEEVPAVVSAFLETCKSSCGSSHLAMARLAIESGDLDGAKTELLRAAEDGSVRQAALRQLHALSVASGDREKAFETMQEIVDTMAAHVASVKEQGEDPAILERALAVDRESLNRATLAKER